MRFKANPEEEFIWAPVTDKNYWTISLQDIKKYDTKGGVSSTKGSSTEVCKKGCKAIMDTGTYLIYGPYNKLNSLLADMTIDSCDKRKDMPTLGFVFKGNNGSFELKLTPEDYVLEFEVDGKSDCVVGIGADSEEDEWTFGQVFLRAYYTVFDREENSIGFVRSNPDPEHFKVEPEKSSKR